MTTLGSIRRRMGREALWRLAPRERWLEAARKHQWVFVGGCNRSGKTTLSNLFRDHPEVSVIPNANMHTRALPDSGREGCPHAWVEKLECFRRTERDPQAPAARLIFDWLHFYDAPRRVILLESDIASVQMRWLQNVFPDASLVGVLRNGYAVAQALRLKEGYGIERCARQWAISAGTMMEDVPRIRKFHLVRHEDFVERSEAVVQDLCEFLGLDFTPLLSALRSGWRLGNTDTATTTLRNTNQELIAGLTPAEIALIRLQAGAMLDRFAYESDG